MTLLRCVSKRGWTREESGEEEQPEFRENKQCPRLGNKIKEGLVGGFFQGPAKSEAEKRRREKCGETRKSNARFGDAGAK